MAEYIKKEDAIRVSEKYFTDWLKLNPDICLDGIRSLPTTDVRPVVRGKWLHKEITDDFHVVGQCSACKERRRIDNFCPNCGADMRGDA